MKGIIYKATCKTNGKPYIGETMRSLETRIKGHIDHAYNEKMRKYKFQYAIVKYGKENFEWEILEEIFAPNKNKLKRLLHKKETEYIIKFDSYKNGYNSLLTYSIIDGVYQSNELLINQTEYIDFCSHGHNRNEQAKKFNCTPDQIKLYRKYLCGENPTLRELLNEYDNIVRQKALQKRIDNGTTNIMCGKDNPGYVEINIDMEEYIKKAKEGLNRQQLADHFQISDSQMKTWRRRMIAENSKNIKLFKRLDIYRKNIASANANKLINRMPKDIIGKVKKMLEQGLSMQKISDALELGFSTVRNLRKELA